MKTIYCAGCGKCLAIMRKAMPKYATIIDVVEVHKCSKEPVEFDLTPVDIPKQVTGKFVSKLNDLQPPATFGAIGTDSLRDRRFEASEEKPKSSAPPGVISLVKTLGNSTPERNLVDLPESED